MKKSFKKISFFYRNKTAQAGFWEKKLRDWIQRTYPHTEIIPLLDARQKQKPDCIIILGGDGTILEAVRTYHHFRSLFAGFNLGRIGFLASIRKKKDFLPGLRRICEQKYKVVPRMMLRVVVKRGGKKIYSGHALNDVAVQNILGMVSLSVYADGHALQSVFGTGALVATATGSTAYNLSAHGPVVMPDIKCMIISEILDHNIPTPSVIIKHNRSITITVDDFRPTKRFIAASTNQYADVVLAVDSEHPMPLMKGDEIHVKRSRRLVRFAEISKHYFFESLRRQFLFR